MDECVLIHWTCGGLDEARQISQFLVKEKLVACVNIIPWVESIFMWDEKMDTCQESLVLLKTQKCLFEAVREAILAKTKYEVPEILAVPIQEGHREYLDWVLDSTRA